MTPKTTNSVFMYLRKIRNGLAMRKDKNSGLEETAAVKNLPGENSPPVWHAAAEIVPVF
jgi:hypothetical protein